MIDSNGNAVTEVHIFCRQMQALASMFESTVICCPFVLYNSDKVTTAYTNKTITFIPLKNVGGNTLRDKLVLLANIPAWIKGFSKARRNADIIYMRFPNNLNIIGFFYFYFHRCKSFATYTGTWKNYLREPITYRFQKWLLRCFFTGPVWIYMQEQQRGKNLYKSISPSYTLAEWEEETMQVNNRLARLRLKKISKPVFITVGTLNYNKNQLYILHAFKILQKEKFPFYLYIVGDGELKQNYEAFIEEHDMQDCVNICGKKNHTQLRELYRQSDFLIQASIVEGFGKVPIEGFFHGVIPLLSRVALADEITGNGSRGFVFSITDVNNLVTLIKQVVITANLDELIIRGRAYAKSQTLENWTSVLIDTINGYYTV
ncbi:MAG TPA: glycosyltransferase [Chitinophagaceae bacterium]|nr:glycosyltransferase [Chitinophagaceae bacterium]